MFDIRRTTSMVSPERSLSGRSGYEFVVPSTHAVLGTPLAGPYPAGVVTIYLGMGCFWGAEKLMWRLPGVFTTAVGYQGGFTPFPTYGEVCTGRTGHAEMVLVAYDPEVIPTLEVLRAFWENHDPTQGFRQGNDVGTQYRSAAYWTTSEQEELLDRTRQAYDQVLADNGREQITTEIGPALGPAPRQFFFAEAYHQQYLHKNPRGYQCHSKTGLLLPQLVA